MKLFAGPFVSISVVAWSLLTVIDCSGQKKSPEGVAPSGIETPEGMKSIVLGAGCFWCVEAFFEKQEGVSDVISGYAGGIESDPTYPQVAGGQTSHAEVVKVVYDPKRIRLEELIDFFLTTHDVSRNDGVWPDFGSQYRSILLYQNDQEKAVIKSRIQAYEAKTQKKVATDIRKRVRFYTAESYHQDYAKKNPNDPYVRRVLNPKLRKLGLVD